MMTHATLQRFDGNALCDNSADIPPHRVIPCKLRDTPHPRTPSKKKKKLNIFLKNDEAPAINPHLNSVYTGKVWFLGKWNSHGRKKKKYFRSASYKKIAHRLWCWQFISSCEWDLRSSPLKPDLIIWCVFGGKNLHRWKYKLRKSKTYHGHTDACQPCYSLFSARKLYFFPKM